MTGHPATGTATQCGAAPLVMAPVAESGYRGGMTTRSAVQPVRPRCPGTDGGDTMNERTNTAHPIRISALLPWMAALMLALLPACGSSDDTDTGQRPLACDTDRECPSGQLCEDGTCESAACPDIWAPVCGVDGTTWPNECEARLNRATVLHEGECDGSSTDPSAVTCDGPNPQGCFAGTCAVGERCAGYEETGLCVPSSCLCEDGIWVCTDDCNGGSCVPISGRPTDPPVTDPPVTDPCDGPSPAGCFSNGCPSGERCAGYEETGICVPSECTCDEHGWTCTTDCGGGTCVPDDPGSTEPVCDDPEPTWDCRVTGCNDDETCTEPPGDGTVCVPSRCDCEDEGWICTEDCGGWFCAPDDPGTSGPGSTEPPTCDGPNPAGCIETGCDDGEVCTLLLDICTPSQCFCDEDGWACTDDCGGGVCVPEWSCDAPNPAGCTQEGCDDGEFCDRSDVDCAPSLCGCDEENNVWICTRDCGGGGVCQPLPDPECGPNPAGCTQDGCDDGEVCDRSDVDCAPSACFCDPDRGVWTCTRDCGGGGVCVPDDSTCRLDTDCSVGQLCLRGTCEAVACITLYDPVCGVDGRTYGNDCEARVMHVEVAHPGECETRPGTCETPNPAGCTQDGCDDDEICDRSGVDCAPSACFCDPDLGAWACTRDCGGGGTCIPAEQAACRIDTDCDTGTLCLGGECVGLSCPTLYDPVCGVDGRTYGNACEARLMHVDVAHAGECGLDQARCDDPNPAGCTQDGCDDGETCQVDDRCAPTHCSCDEDRGLWACTRDCGGGGTCIPDTDPAF
ncbi:MAG: hypothetical protein EA398_13900 [Deltaproteobacteria bacterium]|nr:MAG: hypothetical protein EA398_13900 [Deltaproteobacteria bacterium]